MPDALLHARAVGGGGYHHGNNFVVQVDLGLLFRAN